VDCRGGNTRHVSVRARSEFLNQHKLTVQIARSQEGVETVFETGITLGLYGRWARQGSAHQRLFGKEFDGP